MDFAQFKLRLAPGCMAETMILIEGPPRVRVSDIALVPSDEGEYELLLRVPRAYYDIADVQNRGRVWLAGTDPAAWSGKGVAHLTVEPARNLRMTRITWAGGQGVSVRHVDLVSGGGITDMELVLRLTRHSFTWKGPA